MGSGGGGKKGSVERRMESVDVECVWRVGSSECMINKHLKGVS